MFKLVCVYEGNELSTVFACGEGEWDKVVKAKKGMWRAAPVEFHPWIKGLNNPKYQVYSEEVFNRLSDVVPTINALKPKHSLPYFITNKHLDKFDLMGSVFVDNNGKVTVSSLCGEGCGTVCKRTLGSLRSRPMPTCKTCLREKTNLTDNSKSKLKVGEYLAKEKYLKTIPTKRIFYSPRRSQEKAYSGWGSASVGDYIYDI